MNVFLNQDKVGYGCLKKKLNPINHYIYCTSSINYLFIFITYKINLGVKTKAPRFTSLNLTRSSTRLWLPASLTESGPIPRSLKYQEVSAY